MHSETFWKILNAFWNILEHSACILEHSEAEFQLVHGRTYIRTCWAASSQLKTFQGLISGSRSLKFQGLDPCSCSLKITLDIYLHGLWVSGTFSFYFFAMRPPDRQFLFLFQASELGFVRGYHYPHGPRAWDMGRVGDTGRTMLSTLGLTVMILCYLALGTITFLSIHTLAWEGEQHQIH